MAINLIAYGIARDIINGRQIKWTQGASNIKTLKEQLIASYPAFAKLSKLSFAVNEEYREDEYELKDGDEVVIIPPVSGG